MKQFLLSVALLFSYALCAEVLTYRRALPSISNMDPAQGGDTSVSAAQMLVVEPLLVYDYAARPYRLIPGAAVALPEVSEDGRTYTFKLREAYYTDDPCFGGIRRRVKAEDFVFGWKRVADSKVGSSGGWTVANILGAKAFTDASKGRSETDYTLPIEGLTALDETTLQVTLVKPSNQFLWYLAMPYLAPMPEEAVHYYGQQLAEHPIGAGPYRMLSWRRNYEMRFVRNPDWHGWEGVDFTAEAVPFEEIRYLIVKEATTQWLMLLTGQLDFLEQIDRNNMDIAIDPEVGLNPDLVKRGIRLFKAPTLKVYYVGFSMRDATLGGNKYLRQAINAAFDTPRWCAYYKGRVEALNSVAPKHLEYTLQTPFPYAFNLEKARQLMTQAGYPGGIDPATGKRLALTIEVGSATQDSRETMELLASFLERIGIDLTISTNTWQALQEKIRRHKAQMFMLGWVGDYPDIETFMQLFLARNQSPGPNHANYINPRVDALYDIAIASKDTTEIARCWEEIQQIVLEDCPWLLLHYGLDFSLVNQRITNYLPHAFPYGMEAHYRVCRPKQD